MAKKTESLESILQEFAERLRAHFMSEVDAKLQEAHAEFSKAAAIITRLGGPELRRGLPAASKAPSTGKRHRRSPQEIEQQSATILSAIKKAPGCRINTLSDATGLSVADLQTPIALLLQGKAVKKKGMKRTTSYWPTSK